MVSTVMSGGQAGPASPQRHLVVPVVVGSLVFTAVYSLLHYLLVIRLRWIDLPETTIELLGPALFAVVFGRLVIMPRVACVADQERSVVAVTMIVAGLAMAPACLAQHHLRESTARLVRVSEPGQIPWSEPARYYEIEHFAVAGAGCTRGRAASLEGRYGEKVRLSAYRACPLLGSASGAPTGVWLGRRWTETLGNDLLDQGDSQHRQIERFFSESVWRLERGDLSSIRVFRRVAKGAELDRFLEAIAGSPGGSDRAIVLTGEAQPFAPYHGPALALAIGAWLLLWLAWGGIVAVAGHRPEALAALLGRRPRSRRTIELLGFLAPRRGRWATPLLVDVNVLVFLAMVGAGADPLDPSVGTLIRWGGLGRHLEGQWWRLVTSQFVHAGFVHLTINVFMLALGGAWLETMLAGRTGLVVVTYLAGGLAAGLAALSSYDLVVGASGAVLALFGAAVGAMVRPSVRRWGGAVGGLIGVLVFALTVVLGQRSGVASRAHLVGFATGLLIGACLPYRLRRSPGMMREGDAPLS